MKITSKSIGYLGLIMWLLLVLAIIILVNISPPYIPTIIRLDNLHPCRENGAQLDSDEKFMVGESAYICANIKSNIPDLRAQIEIRVYENEIQPMAKAISYKSIWISNGETRILVQHYLFPGIYAVQVNDGKTTLGVITFEVIDG